MNLSQAHSSPPDAENLLGDFQPLLEQLGSAEGLALVGNLPASFCWSDITDFPRLKTFLENYRAEMLASSEFPLVCRAYAHASRNEFSELLALDRQLASEPRWKFFPAASRSVGRMQLQRLRPLRDQRGLQRYLRAVQDGQAQGWHVLVYGIVLAQFSIPLRQGLLHYAEQIFHGFITVAARKFVLSEGDTEKLLQEMGAKIPAAIENALRADSPSESSANPLRISA